MIQDMCKEICFHKLKFLPVSESSQSLKLSQAGCKRDRRVLKVGWFGKMTVPFSKSVKRLKEAE